MDEPNLRAGTQGDVERVVELGARLHREGAYGSLPYDPDKVRRMIRRYVSEPDERFLCVAEHPRPGALVGMLGGYLDDYMFCDAIVAQDAFFYVDPDHRGRGLGARLLGAFRAWARAKGASDLWLTISSGICDDAVARRYEAAGLTRAGALFRQRLT